MLPATQVEDTFNSSTSRSQGYLPFGIGWYRKHLPIPAAAAGGSLWLDFVGTQAHRTVWLDGEQIGGHQSGHTPYRLDLVVCGAAARLVCCALLKQRIIHNTHDTRHTTKHTNMPSSGSQTPRGSMGAGSVCV
jgi:hypothetical protein